MGKVKESPVMEDRRLRLWRTLKSAVEKRETPPDHATEQDIEAALAALGFEMFERPEKEEGYPPTMKPSLRDFIAVEADKRRIDLDPILADFVFRVASQWGDHRVKVAEEMRLGTYDPENKE